ncbi:serine/threonine protein kinase [Couchioplanes caeruleus]|uniref:serine/threonine-protein kinase n=1 Tax=Couchioplanes caeruleus TaxID=56438 RepID=UPI0020BE7189|nr:serine/threonine-protein kinase [Couchioplanes caeruleus]UQU66037.1 serine/threonine protein kinase [Couchioplanes caeruleus]
MRNAAGRADWLAVEAQQRMLGGRYTLLDVLGRGGMAVVWRARDEVLGRLVAVKLLAGRYAGDAQSRARIRDEARAAAALSHPHIAQIYDYGEAFDGGRLTPYVVMELVHGITLQQRVRDGRLEPREICTIGGQVAAALAAAHADGLVHRDVKPGNVMVTPDGAKVVDFGLAATAGPVEPDDELLGTPAYLAPERVIGGPVEPASDVYALGVLLYRLLTGESPWTTDSTTQMLTAHVYVEPAPLPQLTGVPPAVTDLVSRCLRKEPAERPSAAEAAQVLASGREPSQPRAARLRTVLLVGGVAVAVALAAHAWLVLPTDTPRNPGMPAVVLPSAAPARPRPSLKPVGGRPAPSVPALATTATTTPPPKKWRAAPPPKPHPEPPPKGRAFTSAGGSVTARCTDGHRAELTSWKATEPYEVQRVNAGPALAAAVVFGHAASRIRMTVTCVAGAPTLVTRPV